MTPRDRIHLAALRACKDWCDTIQVRGVMRNKLAIAFMAGSMVASREMGFNFSQEFELIAKRCWREVLAQLHILETAERGARASHGKTAEEV